MAIALGAAAVAYHHAGAPPEAPSSGGACEYPDCFPDETNTGVPSGTSLTAYTGPTTITVDDTVIDSKTITDCLVISAQNVTIRNSLIEPTGCFFVVELFDPTPPSSYSLTIEDSEINCQASGATGLAVNSTTARRLNIWNCENGLDVSYDVVLEDSYIHDLESPPGDPHLDGIQASWGNNSTIRHNTILARDTSAIAWFNYDNHPTVENWTLTENLIGPQTEAAVAYHIYCNSGTPINGAITNNRFLSEFADPGAGWAGYSYPTCNRAGITWTNNVIHETGESIDAGE